MVLALHQQPHTENQGWGVVSPIRLHPRDMGLKRKPCSQGKETGPDRKDLRQQVSWILKRTANLAWMVFQDSGGAGVIGRLPGQGGAELRVGLSYQFSLLLAGCPACPPSSPSRKSPGSPPGTLTSQLPGDWSPSLCPPQRVVIASETGGSVQGFLGSQLGVATGEACPHPRLCPLSSEAGLPY